METTDGTVESCDKNGVDGLMQICIELGDFCISVARSPKPVLFLFLSNKTMRKDISLFLGWKILNMCVFVFVCVCVSLFWAGRLCVCAYLGRSTATESRRRVVPEAI